MKQFLLLMAVVGLAATGCAQNRVFGPQARRGGASLFSSTHTQPSRTRSNLPSAFQRQDVELTSFASGGDHCDTGCCDTCCEAECGCPDACCDTECCDSGCCDAGCDTCCEAECGCPDNCCDTGCCDSGCCGDGGCDNGSCCIADRAFRRSGCSTCGGQGCGPCQRLVGRVASGFCGSCNPHSVGYPAHYNFNPGPPTGQVAYPYYTVRGPRDFLRNNPPSIGPY